MAHNFFDREGQRIEPPAAHLDKGYQVQNARRNAGLLPVKDGEPALIVKMKVSWPIVTVDEGVRGLVERGRDPIGVDDQPS